MASSSPVGRGTRPAPLRQELARPRTATAAAFATQGLVFITLTTRLPAVQRDFDLGELALALVLLVVVLLAGVGSVVAEKLSAGRSSAVLLRAGLATMAVAVPLLVLAPVFWLFVVGMAAYGVTVGIVDATTNMQGVALEHRAGRPVLPSLHGFWTLGGVIGAALALAMGNLPRETSVWVAVVPAVVALAPFLPRDDGPPATEAPGVPWRPIVMVGLALVLFYMVDTAAATWGPTYLDDTFATPTRLVALATFPYLVASGLVRLAGDGLVARFGPTPVVRVSAVVASAALAVVAFAPSWPVAVAGFTLLGAGTAVIAPLSFSAAARIAGGDDLSPAARQARVDAVIARFNQFNYVGALLGSVMTGVVGAGSLRYGFAMPMVLILGLLPLARFFSSDG
ncbi:MFS transporter [Nocardioides sp.]|uniref:MFS transporter n=1 Tax=Nocardioides sp. TaxID=35761 RepID=UPI00352842E9